jgi:chemotaxis protein methyltransferase CheR
MTVPEVSDEEINSLTHSIRVRHGIDFTCYEIKSLKRRVIRIMGMYDMLSTHDLWVKFLRERDFVQTFMNEISVGMTSMFRDPVLWQNLKQRIKIKDVSEPLHIWHSGCSTGEEVYTMSIILRELNQHRTVKAICTDINSAAIDIAKAGVYHKIKMIENEANYKSYNPFGDFTKYYTVADAKHVQMDLSLLDHATFHYQNLITDTFPKDLDIIFCRNVMIYFDTGAKQKLIDKFCDALKPGGFLIIGFFDTMGQIIESNRFTLLDEPAKIFQKR